MWKEKVICPHCGHETYKAQFCKFCGKPLNSDGSGGEVMEREDQMEAEREVQEELEKRPHEISEERKIVEQLSNYLNWRHKLIEVFLNGEASPDIFLDVYKEYRAKIQSINSKRAEIISSLQQRLNELTTKLEQLKVRHDVFNVKLADIPSYEEKLRSLRDQIRERGVSMGLSEEDVEMIVNDIDETLEATKDLLELHKKLKKELDKLELRYKIGELTDEEYQAAKQRIERQMQLY